MAEHGRERLHAAATDEQPGRPAVLTFELTPVVVESERTVALRDMSRR